VLPTRPTSGGRTRGLSGAWGSHDSDELVRAIHRPEPEPGAQRSPLQPRVGLPRHVAPAVVALGEADVYPSECQRCGKRASEQFHSEAFPAAPLAGLSQLQPLWLVATPRSSSAADTDQPKDQTHSSECDTDGAEGDADTHDILGVLHGRADLAEQPVREL
jgi:hypothetical protein